MSALRVMLFVLAAIVMSTLNVSFPVTACWGITATKYAVIIYLGLRGFVIELPQRKLTKRSPD